MQRQLSHSLGRIHTQLTGWLNDEGEYIDGFSDLQCHVDLHVEDTGISYEIVAQVEGSNGRMTEHVFRFNIPVVEIFEDETTQIVSVISNNR